MLTYANFVAQFFVELDFLLRTYVYDGYSAMAQMIALPLAALATLYIVILGVGVLTGSVKVNMGTFINSVIKIGLIYTVATSWGWVSEYVVGAVYAAVNEVSTGLLSASPMNIPGFSDVNGALQMVLTQFMMIAQLFFNSGGWANIIATIQGFGVQVVGYIMVSVAIFEITLAKIMLSILFVLMPVFVCFCFFKSTKGFFDRFVGAIASHAFVLIMVNAVLVFGLQLVYWAFPVLNGQTALNIGFLGIVPIIIVAFILISTLLKVASLAHSLGGSIACSSGSAMLGGMIGGAIGSSMGLLKGAVSANRGARNIGERVARSYNSIGEGLGNARSMFNEARSNLRGGD